MLVSGKPCGSASSIGLGEKPDSVSLSDGLSAPGVASGLRANGSGGVGRSATALFPFLCFCCHDVLDGLGEYFGCIFAGFLGVGDTVPFDLFER